MANDRTIAQITAALTANMPDNVNQEVSVSDVRDIVRDTAESSWNRNTDTAVTNALNRAAAGTDAFRINARNATGTRIDPGDIVIPGQIHTAGGINYMNVEPARGIFAELARPVGMAVAELGAGNVAIESVLVKGLATITQAGLTLVNNFDPVYITKTGSGSAEQWVFSSTPGILVGRMIQVIDSGAGTYQVLLDFFLSEADGAVDAATLSSATLQDILSRNGFPANETPYNVMVTLNTNPMLPLGPGRRYRFTGTDSRFENSGIMLPEASSEAQVGFHYEMWNDSATAFQEIAVAGSNNLLNGQTGNLQLNVGENVRCTIIALVGGVTQYKVEERPLLLRLAPI